LQSILETISRSPEQTRKLGQRLGELAQPGDVVLLVGSLGAGKTCLTQGIAWGLGVVDYTTSPSFVLMREYRGRLPLYHIDLYRLERVAEVADLGLDDYLYGRGMCVVEWADRALSLMPPEHLLIELTYLSPRRRRLCLEPQGQRYRDLLSDLKLEGQNRIANATGNR
jgi:tRNA threonylcarbamoyladenosine biosynthesis protein TsaE